MIMRIIREASEKDTGVILEVMDSARRIMRSSGNLHQWSDNYPSAETVDADRARGGAIVIEDDGKIVAYFAFLPSPEPTYDVIDGGKWLDDTLPYHVIHRIASLPEAHGVFKDMLDWCSARESNIRIDTHRDNRIMQHLILKHGFTYCGIIYLASGDERLAYQRIADK